MIPSVYNITSIEFCCLFSVQFGREVLDTAGAHVKPGITTDEIDRIVHEVCNVIAAAGVVSQSSPLYTNG